MSTLHANTVETSSGGAVTLTNQSAAKYFIHFGMNDFVIDQSLNSSSVTDEGVGHAKCSFTNNMSAVRYSFSGYLNSWSADHSFNTSNPGIGVDYDTGTTKSATDAIGCHGYHNGSQDSFVTNLQTFGDLA